MKKIVAFIISIILVISCAVSYPSWKNIGGPGVYVESVRDTIEFVQLDSILKRNNIHPTVNEWTTMRYYTPEKNELTQFVYTRKDTTYIVNKIDNKNYVFVKRYLNKPAE